MDAVWHVEDHRPRDIKVFMKRLRRKYPHIRYFAVPELGKTTLRPHWHMILFGRPQLYPAMREAHDLYEIWGMGRVDDGYFHKSGVGYILKYLTKQNGSTPYHSRGIGHAYIKELAQRWAEKTGNMAVQPFDKYRFDGKLYPFQPYDRLLFHDTFRKSGGVVTEPLPKETAARQREYYRSQTREDLISERAREDAAYWNSINSIRS